MKRLFQLFVDGCWHKWDTVGGSDLYPHGSDGNDALPIGRVVYCVCNKCGMHTKFKL